MSCRAETRGAADRWLFYALLALLVWAPLPLGSNRPWSMALMEIWIISIAVLWAYGAWQGRLRTTPTLYAARWILALFGFWLAYGLFQVLPLPMGLLETLSQPAAQVYSESMFPAPSAAPISLDVHASLANWLLSLTYVLLFALLLLLVRSRRRLRLLAQVLLLSALFQAVLASILALTNVEFLFIERDPVAHGTYPNRNHLAGFLNMHLALGIGLLMADLSGGDSRRTWRQRIRDWSRMMLGSKARVRIYLAILVITLVLTRSRMGNIAFFSSLVIAGTLALVFLRESPRSLLVLLVSLLIVDTFILGGWFGLEKVRQRLEKTVVTEEARFSTNVQATSYLRDYWTTGSGGGSFKAVFPTYREEGLKPRFVTNAHNDYLEFLLEYGVVGTTPLALIVLASFLAALIVMRRRRDPLLLGMAFASVMGVSAILIHGTADFNLRIPANAAFFVMLLSLPWIGLRLGKSGAKVSVSDGAKPFSDG